MAALRRLVIAGGIAPARPDQRPSFLILSPAFFILSPTFAAASFVLAAALSVASFNLSAALSMFDISLLDVVRTSTRVTSCHVWGPRSLVHIHSQARRFRLR